MNRKLAAAVVCLALLLTVGYAKQHDWQEGKLIDITNEVDGYAVRITYKVDGVNRYIYTASHYRRANEKRLPFTVNSKIKYAVEGEKVYVLDEKGKEHELKLEKKAIKEPN